MAQTSRATDGPILVVEDSPAAIRLIEEAFTEIDRAVEYIVASDAVEAFDVLHGRGEYATTPDPSLVLLDLGLPGRSGQQALSEIRADESFDNVPVVVFSSRDTDETIADCYARGATAYIVKPDNFEALVGKLEALVEFWLGAAEPSPA